MLEHTTCPEYPESCQACLASLHDDEPPITVGSVFFDDDRELERKLNDIYRLGGMVPLCVIDQDQYRTKFVFHKVAPGKPAYNSCTEDTHDTVPAPQGSQPDPGQDAERHRPLPGGD